MLMQKTPPCQRPRHHRNLLHPALYSLALVALAVPCTAPAPSPLSVPVSTLFFGDDGQWSPVNIRVGTPAQWISVLPYTTSQETWVVAPGGCDNSFTCEQERGGIFDSTQSVTWLEEGFFELDFDARLAPQISDTNYADYGLDNIDLGDAVVVPNQIIGAINTTDFWLGQLGLGVATTRFRAANQLTFLSSLVQNQSLIPSHSYGYTAGAYYRLKNVPSSLTLGGVDANRFVPNSASFTLSDAQQPVVSLNLITIASNSSQNYAVSSPFSADPLSLLDSNDAAYFTIDSSTPFFWLPDTVCDNFANALNLTYSDALDLYLYDETDTLTKLQDLNLSFTFSISNGPGSSESVELTLPFSAFDLQLSYPYANLNASYGSAPISYFPLRRALDSSQYTIGRAFLQETYLTVDYERNNFSVAQAAFPVDALNNIDLVSISRPANSTFIGPQDDSGTGGGLSSGATIGIGVTAGLVGFLLVALAIYLCCRRRRRKTANSLSRGQNRVNSLFRVREAKPSSTSTSTITELMADKRHPHEVPSDASNSRYELASSNSHPTEMPAGVVPSSYFSQTRANNHSRSPAELSIRHSRSLVDTAHPPAYSTEGSNGVSPYSSRRSPGRFGSEEAGVSPVTFSPDHGSRAPSTTDRSAQNTLSPIGSVTTSVPQAGTWPEAGEQRSRKSTQPSRLREEPK